MPPPGMAGASFFFGASATIASVVIIRPAIDAASCSATRTTFAGSTMPAHVAASHLALEAIDVRGNFRPLALVPLDAFAPQPPYSDGFRDPPLFRLAWYGHRVGSGDSNAQGP